MMDLNRREFLIDAGVAVTAACQRGRTSTSGEQLEKRCHEGLTQRYRGHPDFWSNGELCPSVVARLQHELAFLDAGGFVDDILVLEKVINHVHQVGGIAGIQGPPAGSLAIYGFGAKQVCPLRHHLMFERALAPAKITMTVQTDPETEQVVLRRLRQRNGANTKIVTRGGINRIHVRSRRDEKGRRHDAFAIGIASSPHLTFCKRIEHLVGKALFRRFERSPDDDAQAFAAIVAGDVADLPQFSCYGFPDFFRRADPDGPEDLAALIALYRPHPLAVGLANAFRSAKSSRPLSSPEELRETRGQLVYLEQAMSLMQRLGGYDLVEAFRLLIKLHDARHASWLPTHQRLLAGALAQGSNRADAKAAADMILGLGPTGFFKATAVKHADRILEIAVLKKRFPKEFRVAAAEME